MSEAPVVASDPQIKARSTAALRKLVAANSARGPTATCAVGVHARATRPTADNVHRLEMDTTLSDRIKKVALGPLSDATGWIQDDLLEPYDQRGLQESDIRCLLLEDAPLVKRCFDGIAGADRWPVFKKDDWERRPISGIVFRVDFSDGDFLTCFTKWSDFILLKRSGIQALVSNSRYSLADDSRQVYLPDVTHFFAYDGVVFSMNWKQFEAAIRFKELTEARSSENWSAFAGQIPVEADEAIWAVLKKSVRHQNTIVKAMSRSGRVSPSMDRISAFISAHSLTIKIENGKLVVDPNNKDQLDELLLIMADGYVTSDITDSKLKTLDARPR